MERDLDMSSNDSKSVSDEKLEKKRHSLSHILAEAVQALFPGVDWKSAA